jgi:hypothetical protein
MGLKREMPIFGFMGLMGCGLYLGAATVSKISSIT